MGEGRGLKDEYPKVTGLGVATGIGAVWGFLCYEVLWEDIPLTVSRRFVSTPLGTLLLMPARIVLWVIRFVEVHVAGHPFDFSRNFRWIGLAVSAVGALLAVCVFLSARAIVRRLRSER